MVLKRPPTFKKMLIAKHQKFPKWTHPSDKLKSPPLKKGDKGGFKESNPPCPPFSKGGDLVVGELLAKHLTNMRV